MTDPPNIHPHVAAICNQLGLASEDVAELLITPRKVTATVFKLNEYAHKHIEDGKVATETAEFEVRA